MGDLIWVRIFFFETAWDRIFFLTYNGVRFFQALYSMKDIFLQCRIFFLARYLLARIFSPRNQSAGYFFSEITHTPLKSQTFGPLACTFCFSSVLKIMIIALENCFIQISRYSCAYITHNLWKTKRQISLKHSLGKQNIRVRN